ncbi:DUF1080 domain-containing protein [Zobellia galactanivorans]|uniref:3-keto-disaccharide hydrolase n=1 Tax=Zobellia galactanivorans (strain DSM 12802 / CCUG 47099 / CIP 106680 / NCIMB 13871 / Dsij) TaxID=63186 RepID=UPI0026E28A7B|nr:DUF1080 domain-containing protein [Zobellia galactanivorans]MDO6809630.1 DUF1080 domain-containing protein [Zobellia galactanivorans]
MNRKRISIFTSILWLCVSFCATAQESLQKESSVKWTNPFPQNELGISYTITPNVLPDNQELFEVKKNKIKVLYDWIGDEAPFGMITSIREYSHFNLELEYKWGKRKFAPRQDAKRDAGIVFHVQGEKVIWPTCLECQIQEGDTGDLWVIKGPKVRWFQKDGSEKLLDSSGKKTYLEGDKYGNYEVDGWNKVRVEVRGSQSARFFENGHLVNELKDFLDAEGHPLEKGNIALQAEGSEIIYRNIRIQELN